MSDDGALFLGLFVTVVVAVVFGWPLRDWLDRKRQVRSLSASIQAEWEPLASDTRRLRGLRLEVHNHSRWPFRELLVTDPTEFAGADRDSLPPGPPWIEFKPAQTIRIEVLDEPVWVQAVDARGKSWRCCPDRKMFEPVPKPLPPIPAFIQWSARRGWPEKVQRRFDGLSPKWRARLWGYDPRG